MRCLFALALWLTSPALATPCLDAGVVEMAAAVEGTGTWQAVVDAHRAALDAGCDDPVIALNLARAQRRIAEAGPEPEPTCAAVDAYRRILDRGVPSEAIATARARADELSALCTARRARAVALSDDTADACAAMAHYEPFDGRAISLRVDLDAEVQPLRARCARSLLTEAQTLDARGDRAGACVAYQRYRAHQRMGGGSAERLTAARTRCGEPPSATRWAIGPQVIGGIGWHLGEPPPGQQVDPLARVGGDAFIERRDAITLSGRLGYRHGATRIDDSTLDRSATWRWHALALGLGARLVLVAGLDLTAGVGAEVLLAADAEREGRRDAIDDLFEPLTLTGELGAGWTFDPLRIDLIAGVDLGPRSPLGEAGGRIAHVTLALAYLFALDD